MNNPNNYRKQDGKTSTLIVILIIFAFAVYLAVTKTNPLDLIQQMSTSGTNEAPAEVIDESMPSEDAATTPEETSE